MNERPKSPLREQPLTGLNHSLHIWVRSSTSRPKTWAVASRALRRRSSAGLRHPVHSGGIFRLAGGPGGREIVLNRCAGSILASSDRSKAGWASRRSVRYDSG